MGATSDMRVFVRVVEQQSFAAAATTLGLSPSAVSKLVTRLEDRLGVQLLHRTTRRLSLSSDGEVYFARARQILADIEDAEAEVARTRGAPRGYLRVNTSNAFGIHQLAPALPDFIARFPEITIDLAITDRLIDIGTELADVTIRAAGQVTASVQVGSRKIANYERAICAAPSYLARHGEPRTPGDLTRHLCIVISGPAPYRWLFRAGSEVEEVEIVRFLAVDNSEAALQLALNGGGIIRLGHMLVAEPIAQGQLVPLLAAVQHEQSLELTAFYREGRQRLPKVRVFLDFLVERFASAPWRVKAR